MRACRPQRALLVCAALLPALVRGGVRSVYSPLLNPGAFSLAGARVEDAIDFAWSAATRPFPHSLGALWTATVRPPADAQEQALWFRACFGSGGGAGAALRLWVDDHFLIHAQSTGPNATAVGYYPILLDARGSLLRVEYTALGPDALAQVSWSASRDGPWEVIPSAQLTPAASAAEDAYQERRAAEEAGWGTFDARDMLASVLLPSGLSLAAAFHDAGGSRQTTADVVMTCATSLRPGLHAARGAYTEIERLDLEGGAATVRVETATTSAGELVVLITTLAANAANATRAGDVTVSLSGSVVLPYSDCAFNGSATALTATCAGAPPVTLRLCEPATGSAAAVDGAAAAAKDGDATAPYGNATATSDAAAAGAAAATGTSTAAAVRGLSSIAATLAAPLPPVGGSVAFTTAPGGLPLELAAAIVAGRRAELLAVFAARGSAGALNETIAGLYTAVAWTTVLSDTQGLVNGEFGRSTKLYEWDTLFVGVLAVRVDPWAAINNVVRVAKGAVPAGFFPGFISDEFGEVDNSKPPVGALALRAVYDAFGEAWVVHLLLDKLVRFNAWWARARMVDGIVVPGSLLDPTLAPIEQAGHNSLQAAKFETGLDNSPLYDTATFNATSGLMSLYDVGMHALYVADARELAALARDVNRSDLVADLEARADAGAARMQSELWCEERSTYLNKDYVTGAWIPWTAPPTLYPLLGGGPTVAQVERMLTRYYMNASEWCGDVADCALGLPSITRANPAWRDQNYWRGRVWGPMNFLVYRGLAAYAAQSPLAARAAASLAAQSRNTFLVEWLAHHHVMENYSALDASGCSSARNANPFYHWAALLAEVALEHEEQAVAAG